ncbi:PRC-barrel domain-containing protein [Desulfolucanica intricata]|uniref:PRC-barrel domain-containing protein n=1 Tax=Desulfolucanica intricata TaxID=1285191 RepID=UPI0009EE88C5|nr:PRC-barrel domain-containing protein [Desulfolucanica intricata]
MQKSKQLMAMPVISLEEGQQIGTVKGLVIDPAKKEVIALVIEQKGWFKEQKFIPFNKINSVGNDAITVEQSGAIQKGASIPDILRLYKEHIDIVGNKIVTETGTVLGYVDEYYIELTNGSLAGIEFSGKFINSMVKGKAFLNTAFIRTIGKEIVITSNEAVDNIVKIEGGIQETVLNLKESTKNIWETTLKKTKELSSSLSHNLPKTFDKHKKNSKVKDESKTIVKETVPAEEPVFSNNIYTENNRELREKDEQINPKLIE